MESVNANLPALLDYAAAAEVLHLSHFTLRRWVSEGRLEHVKLGNRVFFTKKMLAEIISQNVISSVG